MDIKNQGYNSFFLLMTPSNDNFKILTSYQLLECQYQAKELCNNFGSKDLETQFFSYCILSKACSVSIEKIMSLSTTSLEMVKMKYNSFIQERGLNFYQMDVDEIDGWKDRIIKDCFTSPLFMVGKLMGRCEQVKDAIHKDVIDCTDGEILCWMAMREYDNDSDKFQHLFGEKALSIPQKSLDQILKKAAVKQFQKQQ